MASRTFLASCSVALAAAVGVWGWSSFPERPARWMFVIFFLPALWGFLEIMQAGDHRAVAGGIMNWHRSVIAAMGLMLAVKVGSQLAIATDLLGAESASAARRLSGMLLGFFLAIWGNYLPKILSPWNLEDEPFDWQRVHRFAGWVASLCGLALVIVWLLLPLDVARLSTSSICATFAVLGVGRKFLSVAAYARRQPPQASPPSGA